MFRPPSYDHLLESFVPAGEQEQWVVLHTRPRCEKKLIQHAALQPAFLYVPTLRRAHNYGRRVREYDVPLFHGYVFAKIQREHRAWFRNNPYVANLLEVTREREFLLTLQSLAEALTAGLEMEVLPYLKAGKKIIVTGGPMKGLEAVIAEVKGGSRVLLHLELIQKTVAMEIDTAYIKAAE